MAGPDPNEELVVVFESANPVALDIAKSVLEDAEIQFVVPDEGASALESRRLLIRLQD